MKIYMKKFPSNNTRNIGKYYYIKLAFNKNNIDASKFLRIIHYYNSNKITCKAKQS